MTRPITKDEQAVLPQDFTAIYIWTGVAALVLIGLSVLCLVMANRARKHSEPVGARARGRARRWLAL